MLVRADNSPTFWVTTLTSHPPPWVILGHFIIPSNFLALLDIAHRHHAEEILDTAIGPTRMIDQAGHTGRVAPLLRLELDTVVIEIFCPFLAIRAIDWPVERRDLFAFLNLCPSEDAPALLLRLLDYNFRIIHLAIILRARGKKKHLPIQISHCQLEHSREGDPSEIWDIGISNPFDMWIYGNEGPDERAEHEENIDRGEEIILETELERGESEVEDEVEREG